MRLFFFDRKSISQNKCLVTSQFFKCKMCFCNTKTGFLLCEAFHKIELAIVQCTTMRPKTEASKILSAHIRIRMTVAEKDKIMVQYRREQFRTISDFVRSKIFVKREIKLIEVSEDFRDVFRSLDYELAKLGNNLSQVAHKMNAYSTYMLGPEDKETFRSCHDLLSQCLAALEKHLMYLNR